MNPQWNTPPDGDFASYVERLSAQAATARRTTQADAEHSLEGGPTHVPPAQRALNPDQRIAPSRPGTAIEPASGRAPAAASGATPFKIAKIAGAAWLLALVALLGAGAAPGLLIALVLGGLWAAHGLRRWALPQGHSSWGAWLRATAASMARQQRDRRAGPENR